MTEKELNKILSAIALPIETEIIEFKEAKNGCDFDKIGKYFSVTMNNERVKNDEKRAMDSSLFILSIVEDTTVDGPGFRTAIYAAGCPRRCAGCHNPQSWAIENGSLWTADAVMEKIKQSEFANVTFSGGDPLMQPEAFAALARRIRTETRKTIWCYTGYLFEEILKSPPLSQILPHIDVLADGPYNECLRDESLRFVGSANQRLIDIPASLASKQLVLWKPE